MDDWIDDLEAEVDKLFDDGDDGGEGLHIVSGVKDIYSNLEYTIGFFRTSERVYYLFFIPSVLWDKLAGAGNSYGNINWRG